MAVTVLAPAQAALSSAWGTLGTLFGTPYEWYAASQGTNNNPISDETDVSSFQAYFDRDPLFTARKPDEYGKPEYYVAYDRGGPSVGDYLVSDADTYFIINQKALTPSKVVLTNAIVDFYRPGAAAPTDPSQYADYVEESAGGFGQMIAQQWPISLLTGSRGEKSTLELPDSGRMPWFGWLCPSIPGVRLRVDDKFEDENGFRYQISAVESSGLGYRGTAQIAQG